MVFDNLQSVFIEIKENFKQDKSWKMIKYEKMICVEVPPFGWREVASIGQQTDGRHPPPDSYWDYGGELKKNPIYSLIATSFSAINSVGVWSDSDVVISWRVFAPETMKTIKSIMIMKFLFLDSWVFISGFFRIWGIFDPFSKATTWVSITCNKPI